jgi:hypothetical protein
VVVTKDMEHAINNTHPLPHPTPSSIDKYSYKNYIIVLFLVRGRKSRMRQSKLFTTVITLALLGIMVVGCAGPATTPDPTPTPTPPNAPVNLRGEVESQNTVRLSWIDNSNNEAGFKVYRDNKLVATLDENSTAFQDNGLETLTTYSYAVKAFNNAGESTITLCEVRIPNPPIEVRIDRIGVADNGEGLWRDDDGGEVYIGFIITDGNTTVKGQLPAYEGESYTLFDDDEVDVGATVFSTKEVGDYIRIAIVGYESDGGAGEELLYRGLELATDAYLTGGAATLLEMSGIGLGNIIGKLFGADDDWLGSYENEWSSDMNWGIGRYSEITCQRKEGTIGLRLWFTIQNPMKPVSASQGIITTPTTAPAPAPTPAPAPAPNILVGVNITYFEDTSKQGEGPDGGGIGDPYFKIWVGDIEKSSQIPIREDVASISNPFVAVFDVSDNEQTVPIVIEVWDSDGGWSEDEQYDCSSSPGSDYSGLVYIQSYNISQEYVTETSDGAVDGSLMGPQAKIIVEISTLRE